MNELISIIVPVYQAEQYIDRSLKSILSQTYKNIEVILVNDGSKDKSVEIIKKYMEKDERIKLLNQTNQGAGAARNNGLEVANGEYIGFVDSDDWIEPDMYEYLYKIIKRENADIAACDFISTSRADLKINNKKAEKLKSMNQEELMKFFFRVNGEKSFYSVCNLLYKRSLIENIRFPEGKITEDLLFNYWVYSKCNKYVLSNFVKYFYFYNSKGVTRKELGKTDFALLTNWDTIVTDIKMKKNGMLKYAMLNRWRADFTLLSKAVLYGYNKEEVTKDMLSFLEKNLKKNKNELLKSHMLDWKRKVLLVYIFMKYRDDYET